MSTPSVSKPRLSIATTNADKQTRETLNEAVSVWTWLVVAMPLVMPHIPVWKFLTRGAIQAILRAKADRKSGKSRYRT